MVADMMIRDIKENVGNNIIFWLQGLRFEGKILDCDNIYMKYFDSFKNKERYVKIEDIGSLEVKE